MWVDEGPHDEGEVKRDHCYAWTERNSRCGRSGVGWPMPGYSKVYLCGQHRADMLSLLKMAVSEGVIDLTDGPAHERAEPHFVYRYYDADDNPLYIGMTKRPKIRERSHAEKAWFARVARKEIAEYPNRQFALLAERDAIVSEQPEFNIRHRFSVEAYPDDDVA